MNERYRFNGKRLRLFMIRGKFTQRVFAKKLSVSETTLGRMLRGRIPKYKTLLKVCDELGVRERQLLIPRKVSKPVLTAAA